MTDTSHILMFARNVNRGIDRAVLDLPDRKAEARVMFIAALSDLSDDMAEVIQAMQFMEGMEQ